jgi:hypothetical protein
VLTPAERDALVVFGSAAIVLHKVDIGRVPADVDLFATPETLDQLAEQFELRLKNAGKIRQVSVSDLADVYDTFPGVSFDEVRGRAAVLGLSEGWRVASLGDLHRWKLTRNTEKDRNDAAAIDAHQSQIP